MKPAAEGTGAGNDKISPFPRPQQLPELAGGMPAWTTWLPCRPTISNASPSNSTVGSASTMTSLISDRWLRGTLLYESSPNRTAPPDAGLVASKPRPWTICSPIQAAYSRSLQPHTRTKDR